MCLALGMSRASRIYRTKAATFLNFEHEAKPGASGPGSDHNNSRGNSHRIRLRLGLYFLDNTRVTSSGLLNRLLRMSRPRPIARRFDEQFSLGRILKPLGIEHRPGLVHK